MERKKYATMLVLIALILLIGGCLFRTVVADQYKGSKTQTYAMVDGEMRPIGGAGVIGGNPKKRENAIRTGNTLMVLGGVSAAASVGIAVLYKKPEE